MTRTHKRPLFAGLLACLFVVFGFVPGVETHLLRGTAVLPHSALAQEKSDDQQAADESWQVIYIGENRVGYVHATTKNVTRGDRKLIRSATDTRMTIKRFGQTLRMQMHMESEETEDGRMVSFVQETKNPPAGSARVEGRVEGEKLILATTVAGRTTKKEVDWNPDVKSPAFQDRQLAEKPLKPGESRSFQTFLPELNQPATVTMTAGEKEKVKLFDGTSRELLRLKITTSLLPTETRAWVDEQGATLKSETDLLGLVMTTYEVSEEEALKAIAGGELDLAVGTLIKVDPIKQGHRSKKVVYRITTPGEDPAEFLIAGPTQKIKRVSDETVELTVSAVDLPENPKNVDAKPEFLASTSFLQCRDKRVIDHATKAAGDERNPTRIALNMEKYVARTLTGKNFSTAMASAAEVAENLEGDCTEHAVLLAAMLRAKEIPSRIAVGLVYVERRRQFGGHMWSEAWIDGRWVPLDATLGRGGIGGAHIKMAHSSFSDDGPAPVLSFLPMMKVLGKMKIEVVESE